MHLYNLQQWIPRDVTLQRTYISDQPKANAFILFASLSCILAFTLSDGGKMLIKSVGSKIMEIFFFFKNKNQTIAVNGLARIILKTHAASTKTFQKFFLKITDC